MQENSVNNRSLINDFMVNETCDTSMVNLTESRSEIDFEQEVFILKSTMVNDQNIPMIKEKLIATMAYRLDMLKAPEVDLLENFPYFFSNPELVSNYHYNYHIFAIARIISEYL